MDAAELRLAPVTIRFARPVVASGPTEPLRWDGDALESPFDAST